MTPLATTSASTTNVRRRQVSIPLLLIQAIDRKLRPTSAALLGFLGWLNQRAAAAEAALEFLRLLGFLLLRRRASRCFTRRLGLVLLLAPGNSFSREPDFPLFGINAEDLDLNLVTDLDHIFGILDLVVGQFGDVQQTFQAIFQADEDTEIGNLGHGTADDLARSVFGRDVGVPRIVFELLHAQGNAAALLIDRQNLAADFLALFEHLVGMADLAGPRHVADMQ